MGGETETPDETLKRLEIELRTEEIRQLRTKQRLQWITPAAVGVILPLLGAFFIWVSEELKTYSEAYAALAEVESLRAEKAALADAKDSLHIEITALLALKTHHAAEAQRLGAIVEDRQALLDRLYLKAKFAAAESRYALSHASTEAWPITPEAEARILEAISGIRKVSDEEAENFRQRHAMLADMSGATEEILDDFLASLDAISPSAAVVNLRAEPTGAILPGRQIMVDYGAETPRYYDVGLGRFLDAEEAREISR